jgi:ParB-like chromosome segregation protein Spo0J
VRNGAPREQLATGGTLGYARSLEENRGVFFAKTKRRLAEHESELVRREAYLRAHEGDLQKRVAQEEQRIAAEQARIDAMEERARQLIASRIETYPHIAQAWAEWELALAKEEAAQLRRKKHPAKSAAESVKVKSKQMAELRRQLKLTEYVNQLYEFHFPWLTDLRDLDEELDYAASLNGSEPDKEDPVSKFVSKDEWSALTDCERNQRALERYLRGRLTPWQLGRDYERCVGYLREQDGCKVTLGVSRFRTPGSTRKS